MTNGRPGSGPRPIHDCTKHRCRACRAIHTVLKRTACDCEECAP